MGKQIYGSVESQALGKEEGEMWRGGDRETERERERETFNLNCFACTSVRINATE
jgi:hypothetical protein